MNQNQKYQKMAHQFIPGGAHTYSRGDDQYPLNAPTVLERGKGCRVWDADGKEYLDYGMALRAITVGYDDEQISEAAIREIRKGNNLTRASVTEVQAAEMMSKEIPWVEMVKFAKNGSTVTSAAVKLSRAYTGKKIVARCAQHPFFSFDDWFIGDTIMRSGVPEEISSLTHQFHYNQIETLEKIFLENPDQVACVILEPATTDEPKKNADGTNFLHDVKKLCEKYGSVFILDEMITGFRWSLQGAAKTYEIEADLLTYGKGMANGFSVAALGGKKEIMSLGGLDHAKERLFLISTTHGAEMCGLGALMETIKVYHERKVVEHLWDFGKHLIDGTNSIARDLGIGDQFKMIGVPCSPNYMTYDQTGAVSLELRTLFSQEMIRAGVLMPWVALSLAHGKSELDQTLSAVQKSLKVYAQALNQGSTNGLLEGRPIKPVFRKFN
jgi:glutamate-1-semialdehyde 2,1-aminomutase